MANTDLREFPKHVQSTIELAMKEPSTLIQSDLETVAEEIIAYGCQTNESMKPAVELVQYLFEVEITGGESSRFYHCIIDGLKQCFEKRHIIRKHHANWMRFLKFVLQTFISFQYNISEKERGQELDEIMFQALDLVVVDTDSSPNPTEVDFLVCTLQDWGQHLQKSDEKAIESLFDKIRDHIVKDETECSVRQMLMEILEFRAFGWTLPEQVTNYYYGS